MERGPLLQYPNMPHWGLSCRPSVIPVSKERKDVNLSFCFIAPSSGTAREKGKVGLKATRWLRARFSSALCSVPVMLRSCHLLSLFLLPHSFQRWCIIHFIIGPTLCP